MESVKNIYIIFHSMHYIFSVNLSRYCIFKYALKLWYSYYSCKFQIHKMLHPLYKARYVHWFLGVSIYFAVSSANSSIRTSICVLYGTPEDPMNQLKNRFKMTFSWGWGDPNGWSVNVLTTGCVNQSLLRNSDIWLVLRLGLNRSGNAFKVCLYISDW